MLPYEIRRGIYRAFGTRRGIHRAKRGALLAISILLIIAIILCIIVSRAVPIIEQMAKTSTTGIVTSTVNKAIRNKMSDGSLDYEKLVSLEKDEYGNITALVTNMAKINLLQADITSAVIDLLSENDSAVVRIPLGNIVGSAIFSGTGPTIPVKILSVTSVKTSFSNQFSAAGINQTRHQIMLNVDVSLSILIPGHTTSLTVPTEVCIAETVIVGSVPNTYADIQSADTTD
ncbi:MAG: sporulation protein YunB [Oscillospiraceae bacterium]